MTYKIILKMPSVVVIPDGARRWLRTTMEDGITRHYVSPTSEIPESEDDWIEDIEKRSPSDIKITGDMDIRCEINIKEWEGGGENK